MDRQNETLIDALGRFKRCEMDQNLVVGPAIRGLARAAESRRFALDGCLVMKGADLAVLLGSSARK
jgi:hypothetical protein